MTAQLLGSVHLMNSFSDSNVLSVADDGQISVISEGGVHTMSCDASPLSLQSALHVEVTKVDLPGELFLPNAGIKAEDRSAFDSVKEFTLDHTLNVLAKCNDARKKSAAKDARKSDVGKSKNGDAEVPKARVEHRGPRQAKWSSKNADDSGGCLLAVLWFDHRLIVYSDCNEDHSWLEMVDVSELWKRIGKESIGKPRPLSRNKETIISVHLEKLRHRCYMQAAVAIAWSPVYHLEQQQPHLDPEERSSKRARLDPGDCIGSYSLFAVALKSGCIVLQKVEMPAKNDRSFHVSEVLDPGDSLPCEVLFIPVSDSLVYLCQGNHDGTVLLHCIRLSNMANGQTKTDQPLALWSDVDKMAITGLSWSSEKNLLIVTKGHTVIIWSLNQMDTCCPVVSLRESPAVPFDVGIHSSLCLKDQLISSGFDGVLHMTLLDSIEMNCGTDSFLRLQAIEVPWNSKEQMINGLTSSRNGVFLIVALSPASYFCHLTLRKPSKIHWLCLRPVTEISAIVLNHSGYLQEVNDALVYLKWEWSTKHQWPKDIVCFLNNKDNWSMCTTYQLKLLRFLLQIQILYWPANSDQIGKETLLRDLTTVEEMIVYRHVQRSIDCLHQLDSGASLTTMELDSLSVMLEFMRKSYPKSDESKRIKRISQLSNSHHETCIICKSPVVFSSWLKDSCTMGHTFSRCCQTLLLCIVVQYRVCSFCKSLALEKNLTESSGSMQKSLQTNECTYCDGRLK